MVRLRCIQSWSWIRAVIRYLPEHGEILAPKKRLLIVTGEVMRIILEVRCRLGVRFDIGF